MVYDVTQPRSATNHPDSFECEFCGDIVAWDDIRHHYLLSGLMRCVNDPMPEKVWQKYQRENMPEMWATIQDFKRKKGLIE